MEEMHLNKALRPLCATPRIYSGELKAQSKASKKKKRKRKKDPDTKWSLGLQCRYTSLYKDVHFCRTTRT